jgi:hypothetical protein
MRHFINGVEVTPRNIDEIGIISDFTNNPDELNVSTDTIILPREGKEIIENHIATNGLFVSMEYTIELEPNIQIDYYVDFADSSNKTTYREHEIEIKLKKRKGPDDFFDKANGTSFELMAKNGVTFITFNVPYVVVPDNQNELALTSSVTIYILANTTIQQGLQIAQQISNAIAGINPLNTAWAIVQLVASILSFTLSVIALINFWQNWINIVSPPIRFLKGSYYYELMAKGCQYLGYQFSSTILNNPYLPQNYLEGWMYLPVPLLKQNGQSIFESLLSSLNSPFNKGYPTSSDSTPTLGQFIGELEKMFNARAFIINNTVHLERRDWLQSQSTLSLLPALNIQGNRDNQFTYNTEEAWKRYYLHFNVDESDIHTLEGVTYDYHNCEFSTESAIITPDPSLISIKGLDDVDINFAMGSTKEKLTLIEKLSIGIGATIDALTYVFTFGQAGTSYASGVLLKKGVLQVSQQYWTLSKSLYVKNTNGGIQIDTSAYDTKYSAIALYNNYHYINEIQINGFREYENAPIRITNNDFVNLLNNNYVNINGVNAEILRIEWYDDKHNAIITYRIADNWASGKVNVIRVDQ